VTDTNRRPASGRQTAPPSPTGRPRPGSSSPTGGSRAGRRTSDRRRPVHQPSRVERLRTPVLALIVVIVIGGVGLFAFASAASPTYACTSIDTVQPAASGELGQVQPDMGNQHVQPGDKVTYPVCPPASGKHINSAGKGPIQPMVYTPSNQPVPNGWVHNLEHGGLVLLYSCAKGACDASSTQALQAFYDGFPASAICHIQRGSIGPVVAPFDQMPTKYAALVWDRALYLDTLDTQKIYDFFLRYAEKTAEDGTWVSPPEPQCAAPSPAASAAPAPSASGG
jgi:hypothetical protein